MTTTDTRGPRSAQASSRGLLAGYPTLTRFLLRRDRVRILAWALSMALLTMASVSAWLDMYDDSEGLETIEATLANPAMVFITGRNYAPGEYTLGVMVGQQLMVYTLIAVAIMSVLLTVRHTRMEEATGRAELIRAGVVGRHATSAAALTAVAVANLVVATAMALGLGSMGLETMGWSGSLLYGAAHLATGLVFAAIALVCAQISAHARGAVGMGIAVLGVAFVVRGVGDAADNGLSWLSPLGWAQFTHVFHDNRWWPLGVGLAAAGLIALAGFILSTRRDVGAGLKAPKPSPPQASSWLGSPVGFTLRLQRGSIIGWSAGMFFLGAAYGAILPELESFLEQFEGFEDVFDLADGVDLQESFLATITVITAIIASSVAVMAAQRLRSEESDGRVEPLLVAGLSRIRLAGAYVAAAVIAGAVVMISAGLGLGLAGAITLEEWPMLGSAVAAALASLPALWVVSGVGIALAGWLPRATAWTWVLVGYSFVTVYLGGLLGLPEWTEQLSPFSHAAQYPLEDWSVASFLGLTAVAAVLFAIGIAGFRRRDLDAGA